jgi:hypothetical protein
VGGCLYCKSSTAKRRNAPYRSGLIPRASHHHKNADAVLNDLCLSVLHRPLDNLTESLMDDDDFEWNPVKAQRNYNNHGVAFDCP